MTYYGWVKMDLTPEYIYIIVWLVSTLLILSEDYLKCFIGSVLLIYLGFNMFEDYGTIFGTSGLFIVTTMVFGIGGIAYSIKEIMKPEKKKKY